MINADEHYSLQDNRVLVRLDGISDPEDATFHH